MEASPRGVFAAIGDGPRHGGPDVAAALRLDTRATAKLLDALPRAAIAAPGGGEQYSLTAMSRKWMLPSSPVSMHDKIVSHRSKLASSIGWCEYLRTGCRGHRAGHLVRARREFWTAYQRAWRAAAAVSADEVARRNPGAGRARHMLDIGGRATDSIPVRLCRRHPQLHPRSGAARGDSRRQRHYLPPSGWAIACAIEPATCCGTTSRGEYDLVLISSLLHHFDEPTNRRTDVPHRRAPSVPAARCGAGVRARGSAWRWRAARRAAGPLLLT